MIGTVCPVWVESRYLPLVLEQMQHCPGPRLLLWQDQPLYWFGEGTPPSGHRSRVKDIVAQFPDIEVIKMDHAPTDGPGERFGGYKNLGELGFAMLKERGVDIVFWHDTDWLFSLPTIVELYDLLRTAPEPYRYAVHARHYWRDFYRTMATGDITVAFPATVGLLDACTEADIKRTVHFCYHPAYVLSDEEMYLKVHSWGHAPLFKDRGFYEKEWLAKNDSLVKPQRADILPPIDVVARLQKWGAIDVMKDFYA